MVSRPSFVRRKFLNRLRLPNCLKLSCSWNTLVLKISGLWIAKKRSFSYSGSVIKVPTTFALRSASLICYCVIQASTKHSSDFNNSLLSKSLHTHFDSSASLAISAWIYVQFESSNQILIKLSIRAGMIDERSICWFLKFSINFKGSPNILLHLWRSHS